MNRWSENRENSLAESIRLAKEAIDLGANQPIANFVTGPAYWESEDYIKALVEAEKAIESEPNYANAHMLLASLLCFAGRPEEGLQRIQEATRLNPVTLTIIRSTWARYILSLDATVTQ